VTVITICIIMLPQFKRYFHATALLTTVCFSTKMRNAVPHIIVALDFDGVICASSGESSYASIEATRQFWPHLKFDESHRESLTQSIMELRPIIETGYENMLVARDLLEKESNGVFDTTSILTNWNGKYRDKKLEEFNTSKVKTATVIDYHVSFTHT